LRAAQGELDSQKKEREAATREQAAESHRIVAAQKELARARATQKNLEKQVGADSKKLAERLEAITAREQAATAKEETIASRETGLARGERELKEKLSDLAKASSGIKDREAAAAKREEGLNAIESALEKRSEERRVGKEGRSGRAAES